MIYSCPARWGPQYLFYTPPSQPSTHPTPTRSRSLSNSRIQTYLESTRVQMYHFLARPHAPAQPAKKSFSREAAKVRVARSRRM